MEFSLTVTLDDDASMNDVAAAMLHAAVLIQNEKTLRANMNVDDQRDIYGIKQAFPMVQNVTLVRLC